MLTYPAEFVFLTLMSVLLYWSMPANTPHLRQYVLLIMSFVALCIISAPAAIAIVCISVGVWLYHKLLPRIPHILFLFGVIGTLVAGLIIARMLESRFTYRPTGIREFSVLWIGLSYVVLKSIMVLVDSWLARAKPSPLPLRDVMLLNMFFPIAAAGPIERLKNLTQERFSVAFHRAEFLGGLLRFLLGLFKIGFVAGMLLKSVVDSSFAGIYTAEADFSFVATYVFLAINFAYLYFNFSGYIDLALGIGQMLGLKLSENFNAPYRASNIQDFWQRWHMTLRDFVHDYVFFPLAKFTRGRVELSLIIAFTLIGLWHELTWNYLLWGFAQGVGLVAYMRWARATKGKAWHKRWKKRPVYIVISWLITMTYLGWTVAVATAPNLAATSTFTARLFGL